MYDIYFLNEWKHRLNIRSHDTGEKIMIRLRELLSLKYDSVYHLYVTPAVGDQEHRLLEDDILFVRSFIKIPVFIQFIYSYSGN
jgi:hypothetical protein